MKVERIVTGLGLSTLSTTQIRNAILVGNTFHHCVRIFTPNKPYLNARSDIFTHTYGVVIWRIETVSARRSVRRTVVFINLCVFLTRCSVRILTRGAATAQVAITVICTLVSKCRRVTFVRVGFSASGEKPTQDNGGPAGQLLNSH